MSESVTIENQKSESSRIYTLYYSFFLIPFMIAIFGEIISKDIYVLVFIMCTLSAISHFLMVKILELVEASLIQPYSYLQLVFSAIIGVFVFSERLDIFILLGVFIVVSSGLYTFWREKVVKDFNEKINLN